MVPAQCAEVPAERGVPLAQHFLGQDDGVPEDGDADDGPEKRDFARPPELGHFASRVICAQERGDHVELRFSIPAGDLSLHGQALERSAHAPGTQGSERPCEHPPKRREPVPVPHDQDDGRAPPPGDGAARGFGIGPALGR